MVSSANGEGVVGVLSSQITAGVSCIRKKTPRRKGGNAQFQGKWDGKRAPAKNSDN